MGQAAWVTTLDAFAHTARAASGAPGLAIAVAQGGEVVYARGHGVRDLARGLPVTPTTVFGAGSIGKVVTALAIMQLAEARTLQLQDPIVRYLPTFRLPDPDATASVTIAHLLTHTSGLPPLPALLLSYLQTDLDPSERAELAPVLDHFTPLPRLLSYDDLLTYIGTQSYALVGAPGEHFSYSNEGYTLLGAIIERVTGHPFADHVARRVFGPAGMRRSTLRAVRLATLANVTQVYRRDATGAVCHSPTWLAPPIATPAGLLGTTTRDLVRLMEVFRTGGRPLDGAGARRTPLLSAGAVAAMTTPRARFLGPNQYGYRLQVQPDYHGVTLIGHGGGAKGIAAFAGCVPELELSAAVLSNLAGVPAEALWLAAVNLELGIPPETPRAVHQPVSLPPAALARLAGRYTAGAVTVEVTVEDGALAYHDGLQQAPLTPVGEHEAVMEVDGRPLEVDFLTGHDGAVRALAVRGRVYRRVVPQ